MTGKYVGSLSGLFGKAKRKILGIDNEEGWEVSATYHRSPTGNSPVTVNAGGIDPYMWEPQLIGKSLSIDLT